MNSSAIILALVMIAPVLCANVNQVALETSPSSSFILSVPEDFDLSYTVKEYNDTGKLAYGSEFVLSSNGSMHYAERNPLAGWPPEFNVSALLGQQFVDYLREAMDKDGLCSLNGTYNDAGWDALWKRVEELAIQTPCGNRTLKFYGNAMVGILPYTYVSINKLAMGACLPSTDILNISVEVSAQLGANAALSMSAVLRNKAPHNISLAGCTEDYWPATIVRSNGCGIGGLGYPLTNCVFTVASGDELQFSPQVWNATGLAVGRYVVLTDLSGWIGVTMFNVTQDLGHVNQAPNAFISASEPDSDGHRYTFDASESCDEEDIVTDLQVRWDWYSDGIWDTDWSYTKTATHEFTNMSGYSLTVEIKDTQGLVSSVSLSTGENQSSQSVLLFVALLIIAAVVVVVIVLVLLARSRMH